jgi:hypothetical protein
MATRPLAVPLAIPDHLVVAATTLAEGIEYVGDLTGSAPRPGGRHVAMGTHNALLRLGERFYLEVIAVDPDGAKPARPRWFDLDHPTLIAALAEGPRLVHWVARSEAIERTALACPVALGPIHPMARGDYRWRITIPDDGARPGRGLVPTLIQWDVPQHPADALPPAPVALVQLAGEHPDPAPVRAALAALGLGEVLKVTFATSPRLAAMLRTPRGLVTL